MDEELRRCGSRVSARRPSTLKGIIAWTHAADGPHGYLTLKMPAGELAKVIDQLMATRPSKRALAQ